ncbi:hypothetical protein AT6N2_C3454 [Agrobacterium tumefaciens]|nr:hypothetical protein AT6N2_C3454 [Agrobacterium tumefaciens]
MNVSRKSRLAMVVRSPFLGCSSVHAQAVTDAAHRLQINRIGRVVLDLATKTVDLHVDGSLAHVRFRFDQFMSGNRVAGAQRKQQHDLLFAVRQPDCFRTASQFLLRDGEAVGAEHDLFDLRRIGRGVAPQDIVDTQYEFARIKRLGEIVISPRFKAGYARIRFRPGGQQNDRHGFVFVERASERQPVLAGHHHIEDKKIEADADHLAPRLGGIGSDRDAISLIAKEALQEIANTRVVVNDQEMGRVVIGR